MAGISAIFAEFATGPLAVSDRSRDVIRLSLMDWAACAIAGAEEPVSRICRDMVLAEGGTGLSVLIGGGVVPARSAALANGATSHALDFDDTHFLHIGHPSVVVFSAALATAQEVSSSGADFLEAAALGFEASARVGAWLGRGHYETGFHQTATAGSFGATLACGRLMGLNADQMQHALGICSTRASGLKSQFGTMGKPYNAGLAAANAVEAALLASRGFVSRPDGLECVQGFGDTHDGAGDMSALAGLGETWVTDSVSHKFHACCHGTHAALEALRIAADGLPYDQVSAVQIWTNPRWARVCNIAEPMTGLEAKFSYRMTAAMALLGRDTGRADQFEDAVCSNPRACALSEKVSVEFVQDVVETAAKVVVTDIGGAARAARFDLAEPLPIETLEHRLAVKLSGLVGVEKAGELKHESRAISAANSTGDFAAILAGK